MRWAALVVLCACGGLELHEDADGGVSVIHGELCTQKSCASLVTTITTIPTAEGEQVQLPGLAVGGGWVYCSTPSHLVRAPIAGGPFEIVAPSDLTYAIVADDTNVYWSSIHDRSAFMRPHSGAATTTLPVAQATLTPNVFVDPTNVYWTEDGAIASVPIAGGPRTTYSAPSTKAALRGASFYFSPCSARFDLASPSTPAQITSGYRVTADETACYWEDGSIFKLPFGGAPVKLAASPAQWTPFDGERLVVDSDAVYFRWQNGSKFGPLSRVPRGGGSVTPVTDDVVIAYTVTSDTIFWATVDTVVSIKRMPKYH